MSFDDVDLIAQIPMLRRMAVSLMRVQEAEDLVQMTCEKALRNRDKFHGGELQAWLINMMKRLRLDHASYEANRPHEELVEKDYALPSMLPNQDSAIMLQQAIARLSKSKSGMTLLAEVFGETEAVSRLTKKGIASNIFTARKNLRNWIDS